MSFYTAAMAKASKSLARSGDDYRSANQTDGRAGHVPAIRTEAFGEPEPQYRHRNIDAAIGGIGPARGFAFDQSQKPSEQDQRRNTGDQDPGRFAKPQPGPESEAADDFGKSSADENKCRSHQGPTCCLFVRFDAPDIAGEERQRQQTP